MVSDEASLVRERVNGLLATEVILLQKAVGALLSKKGGKAFKDVLKQISVETKPKQKADDEPQELGADGT